MTSSHYLSEKELELLQPDVPEIIDYLLKNHLISGRKVKTRYIFNDQAYETYIYDLDEVLKAEFKIVSLTEDLGVLKMFLNTKNQKILHTIPMNKNIFMDNCLIQIILESDRDLIFDLYSNPSLPKELIQDRSNFILDKYQNIPQKLYDKLFLQNSDGEFIKIVPECFSRLERNIKLANSSIIDHPNDLASDLKQIAHYSNLTIDEILECFK